MLIDILKGIVGSTVLFFAYLQLPMIGMAGGVFAVFPALYFGLVHNRNAAFLIVAGSAAVWLLFPTGAPLSLFYLLQCGIPAASLTWCLSGGKSGARSLSYSVVLTFLSMIAVTLLYGIGQGTDPHTLIQTEIDKSISQGMAIIERSGLKGDELQTLTDGMVQARQLLKDIYPALVLLWISVIVGINLFVLNWASSRLPRKPELGEFSRFKNPDQMVWILIVAGFSLMIPDQNVSRVALNVLIVLCAAYGVQGLAVIAGLFNRYAVAPILRSLLYLFLILQPYLVVTIVILGIFDIWGDFRTPRQPKNL